MFVSSALLWPLEMLGKMRPDLQIYLGSPGISGPQGSLIKRLVFAEHYSLVCLCVCVTLRALRCKILERFRGCVSIRVVSWISLSSRADEICPFNLLSAHNECFSVSGCVEQHRFQAHLLSGTPCAVVKRWHHGSWSCCSQPECEWAVIWGLCQLHEWEGRRKMRYVHLCQQPSELKARWRSRRLSLLWNIPSCIYVPLRVSLWRALSFCNVMLTRLVVVFYELKQLAVLKD